MKTLLIAAATALALASGAANAATPNSAREALIVPAGGQAELASANAAPVGFYRGVAGYETQASLARYAAAQQNTAGTAVGSANVANDYNQSNG